VLLPLSLVVAVALAGQGVVQSFDAYQDATTLEINKYQQPKLGADGQSLKDDKGNPVMQVTQTTTHTLAMGPVASQEAIKMIGTNGGGFFNANSAHPYENPTALTNFLQMLEIIAITPTEQAGNPLLPPGVDQSSSAMQAGGNMEGKEARFGITASTLFATITAAASCGAGACHSGHADSGAGWHRHCRHGRRWQGRHGQPRPAWVFRNLVCAELGGQQQRQRVCRPACQHRFYSTLLGLDMWLGRFAVIVPVLAIAGALASKKRLPVTAGTTPTHGPFFVFLLMGTVLRVGLLNYVPALALGPVVEHLMLWPAA